MNLSIYPILYSNLNQVASTVQNLSFHNALLKKKKKHFCTPYPLMH